MTPTKIHNNQRYLRVTKSADFVSGGRESGEITLLNVNKNTITFTLNASWDKFAMDDGSSSTLGYIEKGKMIQSAYQSKYIFVSNKNTDLGNCKIEFNFCSEEVIVKSIIGCSSFGSHVNVSGRYVKAYDDEVITVR